MGVPVESGERHRAEAKQRAARRSVLTAAFLTVLKIVVGWSTGSLGILSEAANSGLDVVAAVMIYISVWISHKPADRNHPYGHQKVENFTAFLQTGLVLATCFTLVMAALRRLVSGSGDVAVNFWAVGVMLVALAFSVLRARELAQAAKVHRSQALKSHALNYSLDVWSALVVLFGLAVLWAGKEWNLPWLRVADPIAALVVVAFVFYHSARLGRETMDALLDAAPEGLQERIAEGVRAVPGVVSCERVRVRNAGSKTFVEAKILVDRSGFFAHVSEILESVRSRILSIAPEADVVVSLGPQGPPNENLFEKVRWIARRNNLAIHDLMVHEVDGRLTLDLHLEVDESLSLEQAHQLTLLLENQIYAELPEIAVINTHIEGEGAHVATDAISADSRQDMAETLRRIATQVPDILDCHDFSIREVSGKIFVSCHCLMDGSLPITLVHDRTVELEALFRSKFPSIHKVTIHTEPESERGVPARQSVQDVGQPRRS